jgi:hypothetical protein
MKVELRSEEENAGEWRAEEGRMDIAAWLRDLGLEQYQPAFRDNRFQRRFG